MFIQKVINWLTDKRWTEKSSKTIKITISQQQQIYISEGTYCLELLS